MSRDQKDSVFTKAVEIFNNKVGVLDCGYATMYRQGSAMPYVRPYIRVANVNDEFRGKRAKRGDKQYDWDGGQYFVPLPEVAAVLISMFDSIVSGKALDIAMVHKSGNYLKQITIGKGIFPEDPEGKDIYINISTTDRDNPDWDEPISSVWFGFPKASIKINLADGKVRSVNGHIELFRLFLKQAAEVILMGNAHTTHCVEFPNRSRRRGGNEDEDERPRRGPLPRARGARGTAPAPAANDGREESKEEEPIPEDDIPF